MLNIRGIFSCKIVFELHVRCESSTLSTKTAKTSLLSCVHMQSVLIGFEYPVMDTLLFYVENGETPEMSLLTRSRRHSSLTLCSVSRSMYCFVMPQSRPIRSRLLISTTSTFPARTASITSCRARRSRVIPEPCSAAAPTMVYPACSA